MWPNLAKKQNIRQIQRNTVKIPIEKERTLEGTENIQQKLDNPKNPLNICQH